MLRSDPTPGTAPTSSTSSRPKRLGELLVAQDKVRETDVARALELQAASGGLLGEILVRLGALSEDALLPVLAEQTGYPLRDLDVLERDAIDTAVAALELTAERLAAEGWLPWQDETDALWVCARNPLDPAVQETAAALAGEREIRWCFARSQSLERWLEALQEQADSSLDAHRLRELAEDAPVIALVNSLMAQAIDERASDVHVEPGEHEFEVRLRIDGVLHTRMRLPMSRFPAVSSRIKLIGKLDIAERRLPQDGRISMRAAGVELDVRVSSIPAVYGESLVMRLLPKQRAGLSIDRLGMDAPQLARLRGWLASHSGLMLVTGPTGSGKSTTLYSALAAIEHHERKIITVEDPVEYRLPHVVQIQVQSEIGYTFARALRAILRHDPDIIMIGEIRDRETAEIAIQSALTGHLVLATLHTNDALSAFTRLVDMGIEPFLVAAAVRGVMAQRLVRRLCPRCAAPADEAPLYARHAERLAGGGHAAWKHSAGCETCRNTGYHGRVGIYELVDVSSDMQSAVAARAGLPEIERLANAAGRRSLFEDGLLKARSGLTTVDEVLRVATATELDQLEQPA